MTKWKWLLSVFPKPGSVDRFERMRACTGALFGIVLTGAVSTFMLGNTPGTVWLIAPMGASAVLLFAVPASPLAQPWSIIGGNVIAALIGVTCARLIGEPIVAAALAGALAIGAMFAFRCLHPPSGAIALTAVLGGPAVHAMGYGFVLLPVGLNSVLLLLAALFYNNATGRRYPHLIHAEPVKAHATADLAPTARIGMLPEDLDTVLARYNQVLDISRDDLEELFQATERQVYLRRFGVTQCIDMMSHDVISVEFGTSLQDAWELLHVHRITVLPVVDRARRLIGIVTRADFIDHANLGHQGGFAERLRGLLRPIRQTHSSKPEVVGQIMRKEVRLARADQPIVELVLPMSNEGLHALPVIDDERRLIGIITQSDMIAALYEGNLQQAATPASLEVTASPA